MRRNEKLEVKNKTIHSPTGLTEKKTKLHPPQKAYLSVGSGRSEREYNVKCHVRIYLISIRVNQC